MPDTVLVPPDITIIGGGGGSGSGPNPPRIVSLCEATTSSNVKLLAAGIVQAPVTGSWAVAYFTLYRAALPTGPWTAVVAGPQFLSTVALENFLFDVDPNFGVEMWYAATATDTAGNVSGISNVVPYTAATSYPTGSGLVLPSSAYGPYPLLGQDVFVSPLTREGVVGPNGDLLGVNGLQCWAQDLRLRILSDKGELPLHPDYGLVKGKLIGSGQSKPAVQAQLLKTAVYDCIKADPRTYRIDYVAIYNANYGGLADSWVIKYQAMAIGVEDALLANIVYPYYLPAAA
jgi:hypothetical protein